MPLPNLAKHDLHDGAAVAPHFPQGVAVDRPKAAEATQDAMAAKLLALRGTAPWPVCG